MKAFTIKGILAAAAIAVILHFAPGCATVERIAKDPNPNASLPALGSKFLVFWMPVNYWASRGEAAMLADIDACAARGVGYGIEMAGWADSNPFGDDAKVAETIRLYKLAVKRCRERNIWMMTSILNNNCHLSKYGNKGYTITSVWPKALQFLAAVKEMGPANQIVQPLAETQTADGKKWEAEAVKQLVGFELAYNGNGGRPASKAAGFTRLAYHPTKTSEKVPAGSLAVSDCGSIILQLHGTYDGRAKADSLKAWARKCHADGAILAADYAFKYAGAPDTEAIKAIAEVAQVVNGASEPAAPPVEASDDPDLSKAKWHGPNGASAKVTETLSGLKIDATKISYTLSKGTEAWQKPSGDKNCNMYSCFFVLRDGKYVGGKFDWSTYSRKTRELKNIRGGYTGGIVPKTGEDVWFCFLSEDLKNRTNCQKAVWP